MFRIRHLAAIAAVGLAGAVSAPAAVAAPATPAASESEGSTISPVAYADRTMREFGVGNDIDFNRDTTAAARSNIVKHEGAAKHWHRTDVQGAAGHVYVTYENTTTGDVLTLGVKTVTNMEGDHLVNQAA
ncbi:hypothetical protein DEO23_01830 [Brachybacterium endophyticum]|uniref:PepSY domain-containing protein n=1 Tax=Brachybacterium endophyticum TaxID=2182385 RepID=A0A2U2RNN2_9MICO|nr:hypothetical protein [Brachybacterium endophyticum]PWH07405.1 hypothetical protein DEO23_01830 [Brachybacterium endophyticum]